MRGGDCIDGFIMIFSLNRSIIVIFGIALFQELLAKMHAYAMRMVAFYRSQYVSKSLKINAANCRTFLLDIIGS